MSKFRLVNGNVESDSIIMFDDERMREIKKGLEHGVDVSLYARAWFTPYEMRQIRYGLENGIDMRPFTEVKITGNDSGREISFKVFARKIPYSISKTLRGLSDDEYREKVLDYLETRLPECFRNTTRADMLKKLLPGESSYIVNAVWDYNDIEKERKKLESQCDAKYYADYPFDDPRRTLVKKALKEGLNVEKLVKSDADTFKMTLVYNGLKEGLDTSLYDNDYTLRSNKQNGFIKDCMMVLI